MAAPIALGVLIARITPYIVRLVSFVATLKGLKWISSVAVSVVIYTFFYNMFKSVLTVLGDDLTASGGLLSGASLESVDGSILSQANYFFPLDLFASLVIMYVSIWSGVIVFRFATRIFNMSSVVAEKLSGQ